MDPTILAVMSDLHVGEKARATDLCPGTHPKPVDSGYRRRFKDFLRDKEKQADYLLVPGDVTDTARPNEVMLASEVVVEAAESLRIPLDKVIFVPGNHDADWSVLDPEDRTGLRRTQRYAPLRQRDWIFEQIMCRGRGHILDDPHFSVWEFPGLIAVGYNSSWHDDKEKSTHCGLISEESLRRLDAQLDGLNMSSKRLRLFLVHHHPFVYSDPIPDEPDFSAMTNAESLLRLLRDRHFDILIHGHKHSPKFQCLTVDSGFPLAVLGAGSFSADLDSRWSGHVNNQFHLIKVESRDSASECVYGVVESWTYLCGRGWVESGPTNGMRHILPFGTYVQPAELRKQLGPVILEKFAEKSHVLWTELELVFPRLAYLPPERIKEVLDSLSGELGFVRHGDSPKEIVLLKRDRR